MRTTTLSASRPSGDGLTQAALTFPGTKLYVARDVGGQIMATMHVAADVAPVFLRYFRAACVEAQDRRPRLVTGGAQ